jgi:hypothetical protein
MARDCTAIAQYYFSAAFRAASASRAAARSSGSAVFLARREAYRDLAPPGVAQVSLEDRLGELSESMPTVGPPSGAGVSGAGRTSGHRPATGPAAATSAKRCVSALPVVLAKRWCLFFREGRAFDAALRTWA